MSSVDHITLSTLLSIKELQDKGISQHHIVNNRDSKQHTRSTCLLGIKNISGEAGKRAQQLRVLAALYRRPNFNFQHSLW